MLLENCVSGGVPVFAIAIFFHCGWVLQFGAHLRYYKGALTQKRSFLVICTKYFQIWFCVSWKNQNKHSTLIRHSTLCPNDLYQTKEKLACVYDKKNAYLCFLWSIRCATIFTDFSLTWAAKFEEFTISKLFEAHLAPSILLSSRRGVLLYLCNSWNFVFVLVGPVYKVNYVQIRLSGWKVKVSEKDPKMLGNGQCKFLYWAIVGWQCDQITAVSCSGNTCQPSYVSRNLSPSKEFWLVMGLKS